MDEHFIASEGYNTKRFRKHRTETPIIICAHCAQLISEHKRCKTCEVLIHEESFPCPCGIAHTKTANGTECIGCEGERLNLTEVEP